MAGRQESDVFDSLPHRKIAKLYADGYDMEALTERFHWASLETLYDSVVYGRGMQRREAGLPPLRPSTRKTTVAVEEAVMAIAVAKGTINGAGKAHNISNDLMRTLFFERGLDYPRKDNSSRGASVRATFEAGRLAKGFPPITADSLRADLDDGADPREMAARYGISVPTLRCRADAVGVALSPPRLDRRAALRAYESGESVRSIAERTGKTLDYVRKILAELGAFKPQQVAPLPPPKSKGRRGLTIPDLRADIAEGLNVAEIAKRRRVSTATVYNRLASQGWKAPRKSRLPRRMPSRPELLSRRAAGERIRDLAAACGVSHAAICNEIAKARRASA